jgi:hypothetical protein
MTFSSLPGLPPWLPSFSSSPRTEFYDPKTFFTHAASLHQSSLHCAIFPTAASRRSLDRVSVPVWPVTLSGRLLIVALVGSYPANQLIRRELIPYLLFDLTSLPCDKKASCGFNPGFPRLSPCMGQIIHALLTRPPLSTFRKTYFVRLACVRHAASVRPEPGSNSRLISSLLKLSL